MKKKLRPRTKRRPAVVLNDVTSVVRTAATLTLSHSDGGTMRDSEQC